MQKKRKRIICLLIIFSVLLTASLVVWTRACLPSVVERTARFLAPRFGVGNLSLKVKKLGSGELVVEKLRVGPETCRGIDIGTLRFTRSGDGPNQIQIGNSTVHLLTVDDGWMIPGLQVSKQVPLADSAPVPLPELLRLPTPLAEHIGPGVSLLIERAVIRLTRRTATGNLDVSLPVNLEASLEPDGHLSVLARGATNELNNLPYLPHGMSFAAADFNLSAAANLYSDRACENATATFKLRMVGVRYEAQGITLAIPALTITVDMKQIGNVMDGMLTLDFSGADLQVASAHVSRGEASLSLAFRYTDRLIIDAPPEPPKGRIGIGGVTVARKSVLNGGHLQVVQKGRDVLVEGQFTPGPALADAHGQPIHLAARLALASTPGHPASPACSLSADWTVSDLKLDTLVPKLAGTRITGSLNAETAAGLKNGRWVVSAAASVAGASLEETSGAFAVRGLDLGVKMPDLFDFRTAPAQKLRFSEFALGALKFQNGVIVYQMESPRKLLLERLRAGWCGGHIDAGTLRLDLDKPKDVDTTLFCDGIEVGELLSQLNVGSASGEGQLTGRIPVKYTGGILEIDRGFLHSTPGREGHVRIANMARNGLTETVQMAIAEEALKNYKYNWLRLGFRTVERTLFVRLEMNGAPVGKLPFTYDTTTVLKHSDNAEGTAKFQGISFDINFAIPIDDILYYGRKTGNLLR